jgi:hypothetical protein
MSIQGLALLGNVQAEGDEGPVLATRMFDTDGDGQNDLFLVDADNDGTVDGVVRGLDTDQDGVLDTFVQFDEDGEIQAVGRLDPETREFEVIDQDADDFEDTLSSLGLAGADAPDDALFTTFDDPYFVESFGTFGEAVPETSEPLAEAAGVELNEVDETALVSPDSGGAADGAAATEDADASLAEVTPRVVEIEDYSGGGGSDLHAKIDQDGDGLADDDQKLFRTSDGTWHGDVNRDGYSEEVAFDRDQDGRIESVDTTGRGSSTDTVGAERVASPGSGNIVDRHPGEDDFKVEEAQAAADAGVAADDSGAAAASGADEGFSVTDADSGPACDSGSTYDSGSSSDSGSTYDSGGSSDSGSSSGSSYSSDSDVGSTTVDSGGSGDSGSSDS